MTSEQLIQQAAIDASDRRARSDKYAAYTRPYREYERLEALRNAAVRRDVSHSGERGDCITCGAHRQVIGGCCNCCGHDVR